MPVWLQRPKRPTGEAIVDIGMDDVTTVYDERITSGNFVTEDTGLDVHALGNPNYMGNQARTLGRTVYMHLQG